MYDPAPDVGSLAVLTVGLALSVWFGYDTAEALRLLSFNRRRFSDADFGVRILRVLGRFGVWLASLLLATHFLMHA